MSLSTIDFATLESIKQFKAFFDLVQNPKQFADIVKEAEKVSEDARKVVEAFTTVELANEYLTKAKAFANEKTAEIEAKVQAAQEAANKRQAQIEALRLETDVVVAKAQKMLADAEKLDAKLQEKSASLQAEDLVLQARKEALQQKETELQAKEKELVNKAAKLKEIVG